MSTVGQLLPPDATDEMEYALAAGMSDDLPVDFATLMNPYLTPAHLLPWLAGHHSVDLWYEDWPEERKREMIAQSAGVSTIYPGEALADFKGTHEGVLRYLAFVDAEVIDRVAHPARFVIGKSSTSFTPINHPPFKARWLIKVLLEKPVNGFEFGRSAMGEWGGPLSFGLGSGAPGGANGAALRSVDMTPVERAKHALRISKAPETEYIISAAWRRRSRFGDEVPSGHVPMGMFVDRNRL